ncbi:hypothetical protein M6B38_352795 [Iris pallida]|uniref:Uncharacterized protein n=1 Tax=Iris pallida TaxID=29817 RepID=A0AAX6GPQ5_IRIPA|nr:hypothetical protein M6B38_352795 [Iris pallida]
MLRKKPLSLGSSILEKAADTCQKQRRGNESSISLLTQYFLQFPNNPMLSHFTSHKDTYHHHLPQFFTHSRTLQVPYYHSFCSLILTLNRPPQSEEALTLSLSFLCPELENLALDSFSSPLSLLSGRSNPNPPITSL